MKMRRCATLVTIVSFAVMGSARAGELTDENAGRTILDQRCGRCHAVAPGAKSPLNPAPNLWDKLRTYPPERLEAEMSEGMGSRHPTMPQIQFSTEDIAAIQTYLATGED
jgi:mono/diheme cytochrome c family protein